MKATFRITARDETGRLHVATVKAPTSPSFNPADIAATLARASAKGAALMARRGIRRPIPMEARCID